MRFVQIVASAAALATAVVAGGEGGEGGYGNKHEDHGYEPPKPQPPVYQPPVYEPPKPQPPVYEPPQNITKYTTVITTDYTTFCPVSYRSGNTLTRGQELTLHKTPTVIPINSITYTVTEPTTLTITSKALSVLFISL